MNFFPKIVLLGPPASGKSTQFTRLKQDFPEVSHFAVRLFFEEEKRKQSHWSKIAIPDSRGWLPDHVVAKAAEEEILKGKDGGLVIEGFPASAYQADLFNDIVEKNNLNIEALVYIKVPREVSISRAIQRLVCLNCDNGVNHVEPLSRNTLICPTCGASLTKRKDDIIEKFEQRLNIHHENIEKILGNINVPKLIIDGTKSKDDVYKEIIEGLSLLTSDLKNTL
ncbi:adenylate kinase family protein [Bacillus sp. CH_442]|uniref:adenylate kinase family protein n=1 Tax=Bacillus sp. CH_442 TaxID=2978217 RepID=UPI0030FB0040|nr:nucleoside monophosphate kinase [Bacillus thuringiensis]